MAAPFDKKFRQKVVDTYVNGNLSYADVGELFGIGEATVNRWVSRFRKKGKVDASPMGGARGEPLIDEAGIAYLKELIAANPTITQAELAAAFERKFGVEVSRRLISSTLKRIKYTKKRGRRRSPASKRADVVERREEWLAIMPDLDVERLAFLDETGFQHSMVDDFGWAPAGETPLILAPYRGRNVTLIGVIRADGPVASVVQDGYMTKAQFLSALTEVIGPALKAGDFLVMDNLKAHVSKEAQEILASFGVKPLHLPPYSPELNPIEFCWAIMKRMFRKLPLENGISALKGKAAAMWAILTEAYCSKFTRHCGYAVAST